MEDSNDITTSPLAYTPQGNWEYAPFFKRNVFTGMSQADQAANLITSPSFQNFWSRGGNQIDNISAIRIESPTRERQITQLISQGKFNLDTKLSPSPKYPIPPEGIRMIDKAFYDNKENFYLKGNQKIEIPYHLRVENAPSKWGNMNYDWHPDSPYRPSSNQGTYPLLTHEEHNWWKEKLQGGGKDSLGLRQGGWNERYRDWLNLKAAHENVPLALRNTSGAMVREDRQLYSLLRHYTDIAEGNRGVNASSPSNLQGVSAELSTHSQYGKFSPSIANNNRWTNNILFTSSPSADLATDTRNAQRVLGAGDTYRLNERALSVSQPDLKSTSANFMNSSSGLLDVAEQEPEALVLRRKAIDEARRVGRITKDSVSFIDKKTGQVGYDPLPTTTTTIYGPPDKYAGLKTALKNTAYVGAKVLAVVGGALEVARVPDRVKGYYINALKDNPNWRPDASDKFGMSLFAGVETAANFATMGLYDVSPQIRKDATSTAGYGKGYYGTMIPEKGTTSVHYNPDSRYDKKQGFEITDTINDEIGHYIK